MSFDETGHHSPGERLIHMANQIAGFFATQPGQAQAEDVAKHLRAFWEPRMLVQLYALVDANEARLSPIVIAAAARLRAQEAA